MIVVLRIGHRKERDKRISTHCGLVARAFGANGIVFSGEYDEKLLESIKNVADTWGGKFFVEYESNWKQYIKNFPGTKVHLTMYGIPFEKKIEKLKKEKNMLIIIGSEKVPPEVYALADYNLSVTNQPHSEVGALAVFLYSLRKRLRFTNWKRKIIPKARGKKVLER